MSATDAPWTSALRRGFPLNALSRVERDAVSDSLSDLREALLNVETLPPQGSLTCSRTPWWYSLRPVWQRAERIEVPLGSFFQQCELPEELRGGYAQDVLARTHALQRVAAEIFPDYQLRTVVVRDRCDDLYAIVSAEPQPGSGLTLLRGDWPAVARLYDRRSFTDDESSYERIVLALCVEARQCASRHLATDVHASMALSRLVSAAYPELAVAMQRRQMRNAGGFGRGSARLGKLASPRTRELDGLAEVFVLHVLGPLSLLDPALALAILAAMRRATDQWRQLFVGALGRMSPAVPGCFWDLTASVCACTVSDVDACLATYIQYIEATMETGMSDQTVSGASDTESASDSEVPWDAGPEPVDSERLVSPAGVVRSVFALVAACAMGRRNDVAALLLQVTHGEEYEDESYRARVLTTALSETSAGCPALSYESIKMRV